MAEQAQPEDPRQEPRRGQSHGGGLQLRRGVQQPRPRRREAGHRGGADGLQALVACRLRQLRAAHDPDGVAQRRHLPDQRRPRRRRLRAAAVRPAEQLAGQRQPRQGAPPAVAGEEEVRQEPFVGRPDRAHRQRRAGDDGLRDVRFRRRPRGRLGAGRGRLLGPGDRVARRRALHRRPRARGPARRGADGPHLRQPGGPERHARPARRGPRHPRDVPPDGDERRGDGGADRRRPHVRQDARRGPGGERRPRPGGRPDRGAGPRLEVDLRHRRRRGRDHQRARGHLDQPPGPVGQRVLRDPVRLRVGAVQVPGGRQPVAAQGRRGRWHGAAGVR